VIVQRKAQSDDRPPGNRRVALAQNGPDIAEAPDRGVVDDCILVVEDEWAVQCVGIDRDAGKHDDDRPPAQCGAGNRRRLIGTRVLLGPTAFLHHGTSNAGLLLGPGGGYCRVRASAAGGVSVNVYPSPCTV
jgi:hypothetical protein